MTDAQGSPKRQKFEHPADAIGTHTTVVDQVEGILQAAALIDEDCHRVRFPITFVHLTFTHDQPHAHSLSS